MNRREFNNVNTKSERCSKDGISHGYNVSLMKENVCYPLPDVLRFEGIPVTFTTTLYIMQVHGYISTLPFHAPFHRSTRRTLRQETGDRT